MATRLSQRTFVLLFQLRNLFVDCSFPFVEFIMVVGAPVQLGCLVVSGGQITVILHLAQLCFVLDGVEHLLHDTVRKRASIGPETSTWLATSFNNVSAMVTRIC